MVFLKSMLAEDESYFFKKRKIIHIQTQADKYCKILFQNDSYDFVERPEKQKK